MQSSKSLTKAIKNMRLDIGGKKSGWMATQIIP